MRSPRQVLRALLARDRIVLLVILFVSIVGCTVIAAHLQAAILAAVRGYVGGESLWSKGQKASVYHLTRYSTSHREEDFDLYRRAIDVPLGDRQARLELEKARPDPEVVREGFLRGGIHPDDIPGMASLFRNFGHVSYMDRAIAVWAEGDRLIGELERLAGELHAQISSGHPETERVNAILQDIARVDAELTPLEDRFSRDLGEGARWARAWTIRTVSVASLLLVVIGVLLSRRMQIAERNEREVAALHRAAEERLETQRLVERVADATPHILYLFDVQEPRVLYVNTQVTRVLGYGPTMPEMDLAFLRECVHAEDLAALPTPIGAWFDGMADDQVVEADIRVKDAAGAWRWIHCRNVVFARNVSGEPRQVLGTAEDVTERRRADELARQHEAALAHALRVSTLGEMAAVLAHELNQPLAAIVSYARGCTRRLRSGMASPYDLAPTIDQISTQALRAGEYIRHVRAFVRKDKASREPVDVSGLLQDVARLVAPEARRLGISVDLEVSAAPLVVLGTRIQIEQVMLNLVRNAFDAMREQPVAERTVAIRAASAGEGGVTIAVCDAGAGLSPEVAQQAFEPFFTTKPEAMGMGLAISRSIVEAHGGQILATPNETRGTTFWVKLPPDVDEDRDQPVESSSDPREGRARARA